MEVRCQTPDCPVTPAFQCVCKMVYLCSNCIFPHLSSGPGQPHILKHYRTPKGSNCQLEVFLKRIHCKEKYLDKLNPSIYSMHRLLSMSIEEVGQLCSYLNMTTKERCDMWNELEYIKVATGVIRMEPEELRRMMNTPGVDYAALEELREIGRNGRAQPLLVGANKQVEDMFDEIMKDTQ